MRRTDRKVRLTPYSVFVAFLIGLVILINLISWNSKVVSDWYRENVFVLWGPLYGIFTGKTDRSVGEIMLGTALILIILAVISLLTIVTAFICDKIRSRRNKKENSSDISADAEQPNIKGGSYGRLRRISTGYLRFFLVLLCIVSLIQTLNCFVLYHTSTFEEQYVSEQLKDKGDRQYTIEELASLRDLIVIRANELAEKMPRDDEGYIVYEEDLADIAVDSMRALGDRYPSLGGYYTKPKALYSSDFFSQQYMMGYYFPFSMEANYNDVMYISNKPHTMCHELAHTKGYISEDEANLIGFLACIESDDDFFRYSGYLSVLGYINNDLKDSILIDTAAAYGLNVDSVDEISKSAFSAAGIDTEEYLATVNAIYNSHEHVSELVKKDRVFLTKKAWDKVESNAVLDTETVHAASDAFVDTNLKANGVSQGSAVYSEVVALLMDFYVYNIEEELQ